MENKSVLYNEITNFCISSTESAVLSYLNIFSVLLNITNLFFLKTLDKSKRTANFWLLVNIGICDIMTCSIFSLVVNCELNRQAVFRLPTAGAQIFQIAAAIFAGVTFIARNFVLAIGSYERYISICRPYQKNTNKVVTNINLCTSLIWLISFILMTIVIATDFEEYCFGEFGAMPEKPNIQTSVTFAGSTTTAFVTSSICLSKVSKELKRMQSRSSVPGLDDLIVKRSAQYIMILSIALYLSYIPTVMSVISNSIDGALYSMGSLWRWI